MHDLTFEALYNADFRLYDGNPVLHSSALTRVVADPFVLTPDASPDGRWKLFAHTLTGGLSF